MKSKKNILLQILGVVYCLIFGYLLFAAPFREETNTEVNLIPFRTIFEDIRWIFIAQPSIHYIIFTFGGILGNLLLLFPIPILFQLKLKRQKIWVYAITVSISLEFLQYLFQVGSADIDDVILNSIGGYLGASLAKKI